MVNSRLILGGSGSGKSEGTLHELVKIAKSRQWAIVLMDPHGLLAQKFIIQLIAHGLQKRVLYDKLCDFDRILAGVKLEASTDPNPLKRESENQKRINGLIDLMWRASRREGDIHAMPTMSQGADHAIRLLMFQAKPVPLSYLPFAFRFKHPLCQYLIDNCTDSEVQEEWKDLKRLADAKSDRLIEDRIGPIKRLSRQTLSMPAFRERCDGHFDLGQALIDKQIIILDGSDDGTVSKQSVTAVYGAFNLQIDQFLRRHFAKTGKTVPTLIVWEEAGATDIIGLNEIDMLRELRKCGGRMWCINQDKAFVQPEYWETVKTCTPEHVYYNPRDSKLAKECAEDLFYRKFSATQIKYVHETDRVIFDEYEGVTRTSVSKSDKGKTETTSKADRAKYKPITDKRPEFYKSDELLNLEAQKLLSMQPGERMIVGPNYVSTSPDYIPMLPDPWPEHLYPGCAEKKFVKAVHESQRRPEFKTPVALEDQWSTETTTLKEENETVNPSKNLPKPRTRSGNK